MAPLLSAVMFAVLSTTEGCGLLNAAGIFPAPEDGGVAAEPDPVVCAANEHDGGDGTCVPLDECADDFLLGEAGGWCFAMQTRAPLVGAPAAEQTAAMTQDGNVIVLGGFDPTLNDAQGADRPILRYQPSNDSWETLGFYERFGHRVVTLTSGDVVSIGGSNGQGVTVATVSRFESNSDAVVEVALARLNNAREGHTATALEDGRVVVIGGGVFGEAALSSIEIFDGSQWTILAGALPSGRAFHTASHLGDNVILVTGGSDTVSLNSAPTATASLIDVDAETVTPAGQLTDERAEHTASVLPSGRVWIAGGRDSNDNPIASTEFFEGGQFRNFNALGFGVGRVAHSSTLMLDGRFLITGGVHLDPIGNVPRASQFVDVLDVDGELSRLGEMDVGRARHPAVTLDDGSVLVVGGGGVAAFSDPATATVRRILVGQ